MDSGSEIDFNDLPEVDEISDAEQSRESSPSRTEEVSRRSSSPPSKAEEVGHRSSSPSEAEEKSSSTESSGPKVDDSSDSEVETKEDLENDEPVKVESRKVSAVSASPEADQRRSASPDLSPSPRAESPAPRDASSAPRAESPASREVSPAPRAESPAPRAESPAPRAESPVVREESPAPRDASVSPTPTARIESPERKSSQASTSSSSCEERASSMSPEPTEPISVPSFANSANKQDTQSSQKDITRIYTDKLVNEKVAPESFADKIGRTKPGGGNITEIYTASIHAQKEQQSPRLERARGGKPVSDITKLYTANLSKPEVTTPEVASPNRPRRNDNITKLYTNGFDAAKNNFKGKPNDEYTNPKKHNMATSADKEGIRDAYNQVMDDHTETNWAVFKFDESNRLVVSGTGEDVSVFKGQFGPDDKGFGYVKIQTGDEMSKRSRFVLVTWVGVNISVMKKAKMSTDKLVVKEIIQNLSVEIQTENAHELSYDHLKSEVDKAGGARYGTGVREK